jgi:hypothetical protein
MIWKINHVVETEQVASGSWTFFSELEAANCHR